MNKSWTSHEDGLNKKWKSEQVMNKLSHEQAMNKIWTSWDYYVMSKPQKSHAQVLNK